MFIGFIAEVPLGTTLGWGVYKKEFSSVYNLLTAVIGVGLFFSNALIVRHGPKLIFRLGSFLFFISNLIMALAYHFDSTKLAYLGPGILGGFGDGIAFACPIIILQEHFPNKGGIAAAFAVGGYAAGSLVTSFLHSVLINYWGGKWFFLIAAFFYLFIQMLCSFFIVSNNLESPNTRVEYLETIFLKPESILKHSSFIVFSIMFALNCLAYFCYGSRVQTDTEGMQLDQNLTIGLLGLFNLLGRFVFGFLLDLFSILSCLFPILFVITQLMHLASSIGFFFAFRNLNGTIYQICILLAAFSYGSSISIVTGSLKRLYGSQHLSLLISFFFAAWSFFSLSTIPIRHYLDQKQTLLMIIPSSVLGLFLSIWLVYYSVYRKLEKTVSV